MVSALLKNKNSPFTTHHSPLNKMEAVKKKLPVLILSTYPADQYAARLIKAGAEDFICKDTLPGGLIKSIRVILGIEKKNG